MAIARWAKVLRVGKICGLDTRGSDGRCCQLPPHHTPTPQVAGNVLRVEKIYTNVVRKICTRSLVKCLEKAKCCKLVSTIIINSYRIFQKFSTKATSIQTSAGECEIILYCKCKQKFCILLPMSVRCMYNVERGKIQKVAFTNCLVASKYRLLFYWMNLRLI